MRIPEQGSIGITTSNGTGSDDANSQSVNIRLDTIVFTCCVDGGVVEGKGSAAGVVAYSSAYTAKVGDVVAVFRGYLCACNK